VNKRLFASAKRPHQFCVSPDLFNSYRGNTLGVTLTTRFHLVPKGMRGSQPPLSVTCVLRPHRISLLWKATETVPLYIYIYIFIYLFIYTHIYINKAKLLKDTHTHTHIYIYVCVCVCVCTIRPNCLKTKIHLYYI